MNSKLITIGDKTYRLMYDEFGEDIDIDELLKIDYSNLIGEIVTFPVIVNRFGQLLAEAESKLAEAKLNLDVHEAKVKERLRVSLTDDKAKAPTVEALTNATYQDSGYQAMRKRYIESQKMRDYMSSLFWSAKDKSAKLDKLSLTIQQGDITDAMIEGKVNSVIVKRTKKLID